jgi:hypothetical protein
MADDAGCDKRVCDLEQHRWAAAQQRHERLVADTPNDALGGEVAVAAGHALAVRAPVRRAAGRCRTRHLRTVKGNAGAANVRTAPDATTSAASFFRI